MTINSNEILYFKKAGESILNLHGPEVEEYLNWIQTVHDSAPDWWGHNLIEELVAVKLINVINNNAYIDPYISKSATSKLSQFIHGTINPSSVRSGNVSLEISQLINAEVKKILFDLLK